MNLRTYFSLNMNLNTSNFINQLMSERSEEIAYDIRLEISRDEILNRIWLGEELQIQVHPELRESIIKSFKKIS